MGDVENVKDHYDGTGTSSVGTQRRDDAMKVVAIVRTGHLALDAAIASDRNARPDLDVLQAGCRRAGAARGIHYDQPAARAGSIVDRMSLTPDRDGAGDTLHAGTTHTVKAANGRPLTIRVWHELATHGCN